MFDFIKNKDDKNIYAPVTGKCVDITECSDITFSQKLLGDGFVIIPEDDLIYSPCEGTIAMIFPTKHSFGIRMKDKTEIIVHIGINTVDLNGVGFEMLCSVGQKVKKGTTIVKVDNKLLKEKGYDNSVIVIVSESYQVHKKHLNEIVKKGETIIEGQYEDY